MDSYPPDYLNTTIESGDNGLSNPLLRYVGNHSTLNLLLQCQDINCLGLEKTSNALVGKLYATCSEQEILQKINVNTANDLERGRDKQVNKHLALKSFQRSDASRTFSPEEIRPLIWCRRTLYYILCHFVDADINPKKYLMRDDYAFIDVYNFLRDRLRSIWQDLTVQHCTKHRAYIECFEISIRFLLYSHYKLLGHPEYDSVQNLGLINTCLEKLMNGYSDVRNYRHTTTADIYDILVYSSPYQAEFWSYQLLIAIKNIQNPGGATIFVDLCKKMPHDLFKSPLVQLAIKAYLTAYNNNIYRYLKLIGDATPLQALLINRFLGLVRVRWLYSLVKNKVVRSQITFETFAKYFDNPDPTGTGTYTNINRFSERYAIQVVSDNNVSSINLNVCNMEALEEDICSLSKVCDRLESPHLLVDAKLAEFESRQKIFDPDFEVVETPRAFDESAPQAVNIELPVPEQAQMMPKSHIPDPIELKTTAVHEVTAIDPPAFGVAIPECGTLSIPSPEGPRLGSTILEGATLEGNSLDSTTLNKTCLDKPVVMGDAVETSAPVASTLPLSPLVDTAPDTNIFGNITLPPIAPLMSLEPSLPLPIPDPAPVTKIEISPLITFASPPHQPEPVPPINITKINEPSPKPNYNITDFNKTIVDKLNLPKISTNHEITRRVQKNISLKEEAIKELNAINEKFNKRERVCTNEVGIKPIKRVKRQKSCVYRKVSIMFHPIQSITQYAEKLSLNLYYYKQMLYNCFHDISNLKVYGTNDDPILSDIKLGTSASFRPFKIKDLVLRLHFVCNINQSSALQSNTRTPPKYPIHLCALFANEIGFNSTAIFRDSEAKITKFGTFSTKKLGKKLKKFTAIYSLSRSALALNNPLPVNGFVLILTYPIELKAVDGEIIFSNKSVSQWLNNINILTIKPIIENIKNSHGRHGLLLFYVVSLHSDTRILPKVDELAARINKKVYKHLIALASIYMDEITLSGRVLGSKKKSPPFIVDMLGYVNGKETKLRYGVIHKSMKNLVTHCFELEGLNLSLGLPNYSSLKKNILQLLLKEHDWESDPEFNINKDFTLHLANALYNKISNYYAFNPPSIRKSMFDCVRDNFLKERTKKHHLLNLAIRKLISRDYDNKFMNLKKDIQACIQASIGDLYIDRTNYQIAPRNKKLMIMQYIYSCIKLITKGLDNLELQ